MGRIGRIGRAAVSTVALAALSGLTLSTSGVAAQASPSSTDRASETGAAAGPVSVRVVTHGTYALPNPIARVEVDGASHVALFEVEPGVGAVRLYSARPETADLREYEWRLAGPRVAHFRDGFRFRYGRHFAFATTHRPEVHLLAVASRDPLRLERLQDGRYWPGYHGGDTPYGAVAALVRTLTGRVSGPGIAWDLARYSKFRSPALAALFGLSGAGFFDHPALCRDRGGGFRRGFLSMYLTPFISPIAPGFGVFPYLGHSRSCLGSGSRIFLAGEMGHAGGLGYATRGRDTEAVEAVVDEEVRRLLDRVADARERAGGDLGEVLERRRAELGEDRSSFVTRELMDRIQRQARLADWKEREAARRLVRERRARLHRLHGHSGHGWLESVGGSASRVRVRNAPLESVGGSASRVRVRNAPSIPVRKPEIPARKPKKDRDDSGSN